MNNKEALSRHVASIVKKVGDMYAFKEEIVELKFVANETEQDIEAWVEGIDTKLAKMDKKVASIRELLAKNDENEKGLQRVQVQRAADEKEREKLLAPYKRNLSCKEGIEKKRIATSRGDTNPKAEILKMLGNRERDKSKQGKHQ